jgi:hypothetical protein
VAITVPSPPAPGPIAIPEKPTRGLHESTPVPAAEPSEPKLPERTRPTTPTKPAEDRTPGASSPGTSTPAPSAPAEEPTSDRSPDERHASWADVSRALAAKDDGRARQALESLGNDSDPATRAKAKLGLAQLAASRGDCDRARVLAGEVARSGEADARTASRARALIARCAR